MGCHVRAPKKPLKGSIDEGCQMILTDLQKLELNLAIFICFVFKFEVYIKVSMLS